MDTGIIGPVTVMKRYVSEFGSESPTIHGLIVSSILIPAALSSFFAGRIDPKIRFVKPYRASTDSMRLDQHQRPVKMPAMLLTLRGNHFIVA